MLGLGAAWKNGASYPEGTLWAHAVSAGEVVAAKAAAPLLAEAYPQWPLVASTVTETGQAAARRMLVEARETFYFPADFSWNVRRFLRRFNPRIVALFEAELWPNFLIHASNAGAAIFLLNGRVSVRSHRRYMRFRQWIAPPIRRISAFCMQSQGDAARMAEILGGDRAIHVTGDCKFDVDFPVLAPPERARWREELGLDESRPVLVAGSTHPGEEETILAAFEEARRAVPDAALILCPRHPERFGEAAALLERRGLRTRRASRSEAVESPDAVLLDTMGQLARAYGLGEIAIVGGSFAPIGGHNLLEAAAHCVPVIYGPHMHRQPDMLRLFGERDAGLQPAPERLGELLAALLRDPQRRNEMGRRARSVIDGNRGAARRMLDIVRECMARQESARP